MRNRKKFDQVSWCVGEVNAEGIVVSVVYTSRYEGVARRWLEKTLAHNVSFDGPNGLPLQVFVGSQGQ